MSQAPAGTVLVVDDAPENLSVLADLLHPHYRVLAATSGEDALEIAGSGDPPELILLDIMMPGLDGYETLRLLQANPATASIPVIFVTAMSDTKDELRGLGLGAVDYLTKPIVPLLVLVRVNTQLQLKRAQDRLRGQNLWLENEVKLRMEENDRVQQAAIRALAHLAETRDPETGRHILRTQHYVATLAHRLQTHPRFGPTLTWRMIELLTRSAPLHDIGKVGVPDAVLNKPGSLDAEEWVLMQTHARLGAEAIDLAEQDLDESIAFLGVAKEIARSHHEKWDGSGYPDGLAGDAIPISARLMALADVFDALISRRCYKPPMSAEDAHAIIMAGSGTHFDPDVAEAFDACFDDFLAIALDYAEDETA